VLGPQHPEHGSGRFAERAGNQAPLSGAHRAGREAAADTVNTMPEKTLLAFADHGEAEGDKVTAPPRGHRRCSTPSNASASKPQVGQ
jgi:hypothetical protein